MSEEQDHALDALRYTVAGAVDQASLNSVRVDLDKLAPQMASQIAGFNGEKCVFCGNRTLRQTGPCLTCASCGQSTSCG